MNEPILAYYDEITTILKLAYKNSNSHILLNKLSSCHQYFTLYYTSTSWFSIRLLTLYYLQFVIITLLPNYIRLV